MAGGVVYLVYDQQLLGPSDKSHAVLQKAEEVVPPAMYQLSQYVCEQTGLKIPQVPRAEAWREGAVNSGVAFCPWSLKPCWEPSTLGRVLPSLPLREAGAAGPFPFHQALSPVSSQLPAPPKFNFHIRESWNSGRLWSLCFGGGPRFPRLALPTLLPGMPFHCSLNCCVCLHDLKKKDGGSREVGAHRAFL